MCPEYPVTYLSVSSVVLRHRGKIEAVINNAKKARALIKTEDTLAAFLWRYEPSAEALAVPQTQSVSAQSIALSKELKRQGRAFVGPTTVCAFMQAMGLVNDHVEACVVRDKVEKARAGFPSRSVK
jgi:DNA-3-methyladenine glycosylase I